MFFLATNISVKYIIMAVVALIVIAVLFPIGLGLIGNAGETWISLNATTSDQLKNLVDPTVLILLTILVPILAVIGVVMFFLPRGSD